MVVVEPSTSAAMTAVSTPTESPVTTTTLLGDSPPTFNAGEAKAQNEEKDDVDAAAARGRKESHAPATQSEDVTPDPTDAFRIISAHHMFPTLRDALEYVKRVHGLGFASDEDEDLNGTHGDDDHHHSHDDDHHGGHGDDGDDDRGARASGSATAAPDATSSTSARVAVGSPRGQQEDVAVGSPRGPKLWRGSKSTTSITAATATTWTAAGEDGKRNNKEEVV
jgi:hypothetical protein